MSSIKSTLTFLEKYRPCRQVRRQALAACTERRLQRNETRPDSPVVILIICMYQTFIAFLQILYA